ncbi:hypothetical protein P7K49_013348 [Saguinus oedipus]|uniref:Uncharacterized protein n=1 Tax=Saguinus oedipus TaxID=9490 RepID=A0ABQ9VFM3_SAGOE|nr:hypothetical protein P7K49_013348 [Saguinus oedipus]
MAKLRMLEKEQQTDVQTTPYGQRRPSSVGPPRPVGCFLGILLAGVMWGIGCGLQQMHRQDSDLLNFDDPLNIEAAEHHLRDKEDALPKPGGEAQSGKGSERTLPLARCKAQGAGACRQAVCGCD